MAKSKKPPKARKRQKPQEKDLGTAETRAKLKPDPLQRIVEEGLLDSAGQRAAEEIRAVWLALTLEVRRKNKVLGTPDAGKVEMPDQLAEAHATRYLPWVRETNSEIVDLTIGLLVDRRELTPWGCRICAGAITNYARRM